MEGKYIDNVCCLICDPKNKFKNCICNPSFIEFNDTLNKINNTTIRVINFNILKPFKISTITLCCNYNSTIDVNKYNKVYFNNKNNFYNCINIKTGVKYQKKVKIGLKIFKNGNLQLCGVENLMSGCYAIRKIFKRLLKNNCFNEVPYISNVRICMINGDFRIDKNLKQNKMCQLLDNKELDNVLYYSYNTTKYPAINIKCGDSEYKTSCMIFRTGSIIITGGIFLKQHYDIYKNLLLLFENNNNILYNN